ncbi:MAG: type II toxin-antitoxin system CcdA family antitoxin [Gallionella sp.]|nr:type II toxin-antitoxin system CcdA family antitoxin [Gallionella sp.]
MSNIIFNPTAEQKQAELIRQAQCNQWLEEYKNALDEYNRRIETRGTFSDGLRRF